MSLRVKPPTEQSIRCRCEGGAHRAAEHSKPGKKAADHGDPFAHVPGCIHSDLQRTTKPPAKRRTISRVRLP